MEIEESLRRALRVEEPAPDFTQRVMARVAVQSQARRRARWQVPLALAASCVLAVVALGIVQQQREAQRLQSARQLAIVDRRNPTPMGRENARAFAKSLAGAGLVITSGMAPGCGER